jgi:hypothetical protein
MLKPACARSTSGAGFDFHEALDPARIEVLFSPFLLSFKGLLLLLSFFAIPFFKETR